MRRVNNLTFSARPTRSDDPQQTPEQNEFNKISKKNETHENDDTFVFFADNLWNNGVP